jgi:hypothetical protein
VGCQCLEELSALTLRHNSWMIFVVFRNTSRLFLCRRFNSHRLLSVNYLSSSPHRDGTHIHVKCALFSWFIPSGVAMSTHEASRPEKRLLLPVTPCFTVVLGTEGPKPWTVRVQRERRHGNTVNCSTSRLWTGQATSMTDSTVTHVRPERSKICPELVGLLPSQ